MKWKNHEKGNFIIESNEEPVRGEVPDGVILASGHGWRGKSSRKLGLAMTDLTVDVTRLGD